MFHLNVRLYFLSVAFGAARPLILINTDPCLRLIETYLYRAAKSTSHSLNMKNGVWEGEGRAGEGEGGINDMDLHVQTEPASCVCVFACVHWGVLQCYWTSE